MVAGGEMSDACPPPMSVEQKGEQDIYSIIAVTSGLLLACILHGAVPAAVRRVIPTPILVFIVVLVVFVIVFTTKPRLLVEWGGFALDPLFIQALFLPPLIFKELLTLNIETFKRSFFQVLWLIGPGVLAGAAATALFPYSIMPSKPKFGFDLAMAFGAMMATTDPVALIITLNRLGAPKRLTALIGNESLLNDGTSIILLTLFLDFQANVAYTPGAIVGFCFRQLFASIAFGSVVAVVSLLFLSVVKGHGVTVVMTSIAVPFLTFAVAIEFLDTSGVLSIVPVGLAMNEFGRTRFLPHKHFAEHCWELLEFLATNMLYALAGFLVAADLANNSIDGTDWGSLFALYLYMNLVRFLFFFVSFPLLQMLGYGWSGKETILASWGGLRGATGLALGIQIKNSPGVSQREGELVSFFMGGTVILFLINTFTSGPLLQSLKLTWKPSEEENLVVKRLEVVLWRGFRRHNASNACLAKLFPELTKTPPPHAPVPAPSAMKIEPDWTTSMTATAEKRVSSRMLVIYMRNAFRALHEADLITSRAWYCLDAAAEKTLDQADSVEDGFRSVWRSAMEQTIHLTRACCKSCRRGELAGETESLVGRTRYALLCLKEGNLDELAAMVLLRPGPTSPPPTAALGSTDSSKSLGGDWESANETESNEAGKPPEEDLDDLEDAAVFTRWWILEHFARRGVPLPRAYTMRLARTATLVSWAFVLVQKRIRESFLSPSSSSYEASLGASRLPETFLRFVAQHLPGIAKRVRVEQTIAEIRHRYGNQFVHDMLEQRYLEEKQIQRLLVTQDALLRDAARCLTFRHLSAEKMQRVERRRDRIERSSRFWYEFFMSPEISYLHALSRRGSRPENTLVTEPASIGTASMMRREDPDAPNDEEEPTLAEEILRKPTLMATGESFRAPGGVELAEEETTKLAKF